MVTTILCNFPWYHQSEGQRAFCIIKCLFQRSVNLFCIFFKMPEVFPFGSGVHVQMCYIDRLRFCFCQVPGAPHTKTKFRYFSGKSCSISSTMLKLRNSKIMSPKDIRDRGRGKLNLTCLQNLCFLNSATLLLSFERSFSLLLDEFSNLLFNHISLYYKNQ
nr:uncharacterized protein LOC101148364 isoform X3 [Gorilla gorilla gorilla]